MTFVVSTRTDDYVVYLDLYPLFISIQFCQRTQVRMSYMLGTALPLERNKRRPFSGSPGAEMGYLNYLHSISRNTICVIHVHMYSCQPC